MIQVFTDGVLAYDSRLEEYDLAGLKATRGLNIGGTAEIIMPPGHPAYNAYKDYKTIVEIYRDRALRFRGRPIYPSDNYYGQRTITCEGELCFLRDGIARPYIHQDTPENIFTATVQEYNSQVDEFKQFKIGQITVTDPNDYVRLESEEAETTLDKVNKLIERCGGYVKFTTDLTGARVINWLEETGSRSAQTIEFGENLLDFNRSGSENTEMATVLVPYGAKDEKTGLRLTIESVNGGKDYIQADDAIAVRGRIVGVAIWDDVTDPENLLRKAEARLATRKAVITALTLTALDLSLLDKDIDSFTEGDKIRVKSPPHGVNEDFQLTQMTEDFLNPVLSTINLGKDLQSLTRADVIGDATAQKELHKVSRDVTASYNLNIADAVQASENALASLIQQTSEEIMQEVSRTYTTNDQLAEAITSRMTQLENQFLFEFETIRATVEENNAEAALKFTEIYNYISFENGDIRLGGSDSPITLTLQKDKIVFKNNGQQFGWWDGVDFHTGNIVVEVNERAQFGDFAFVPRSNGSLSFLKIK